MYIVQVFQDWFLVLEKLIMHLYIDSRKRVIPLNNTLQEILKILLYFCTKHVGKIFPMSLLQ